MSPVEWSGNPIVPPGGGESQMPAPAPAPSGWPSTLAGYAKALLAILGTVPAAVVVTWLQSAGVTHMPAWLSAAIPVVLGIVAVLFGPRNRES